MRKFHGVAQLSCQQRRIGPILLKQSSREDNRGSKLGSGQRRVAALLFLLAGESDQKRLMRAIETAAGPAVAAALAVMILTLSVTEPTHGAAAPNQKRVDPSLTLQQRLLLEIQARLTAEQKMLLAQEQQLKKMHPGAESVSKQLQQEAALKLRRP